MGTRRARPQADLDGSAFSGYRFPPEVIVLHSGAPLFPVDACPTDAERAAEQLVERLCCDAHYAEAAAAGIDCGVPAQPQSFGAIGPLVDLCLAGDQPACSRPG